MRISDWSSDVCSSDLAIRNVKLKDELTALTKATADQVACEWFEHPASIALMTGLAAGAGPIDDDGNAAAYMIIAMLHRLGTGKPIGSLQTFSTALANSIETRSEAHLAGTESASPSNTRWSPEH